MKNFFCKRCNCLLHLLCDLEVTMKLSAWSWVSTISMAFVAKTTLLTLNLTRTLTLTDYLYITS